MKKLLLWSGLIVSFVAMQSTISYADDFQDNTNEPDSEIVNRAGYANIFFKSYPPKTHKGWTLVAVKKVSGGYMGMYM